MFMLLEMVRASIRKEMAPVFSGLITLLVNHHRFPHFHLEDRFDRTRSSTRETNNDETTFLHSKNGKMLKTFRIFVIRHKNCLLKENLEKNEESSRISILDKVAQFSRKFENRRVCRFAVGGTGR